MDQDAIPRRTYETEFVQRSDEQLLTVDIIDSASAARWFYCMAAAGPQTRLRAGMVRALRFKMKSVSIFYRQRGSEMALSGTISLCHAAIAWLRNASSRLSEKYAREKRRLQTGVKLWERCFRLALLAV